MDTLQNILYLRSLKRWRLGWTVTSVAALALLILALLDSVYESNLLVDNTIDFGIMVSFLAILMFGVYFAYRNNKILQQIERSSELPPGFYQNVTEKEYCAHCGHRLGAEGKYCEYCGHLGSK